MTDYEFVRAYVELAQHKRVKSRKNHDQRCECKPCDLERIARRKMEEMPEHLRSQKNWVYLMLEKLGKI